MKIARLLLLPAMLLALPLTVLADPGKDESGKGRGHDRGEYRENQGNDRHGNGHGNHGKGRDHERREYKEEYSDGNCKVERKFEKNGGYKEERKCEGGDRYAYPERPTVRVPVQPPVPQAVHHQDGGITLRGVVNIPESVLSNQR